MRILYVIPTMGCGGAEVLIGAIARNLYSKGHIVHIACLQEHHETWPNFPDREALTREIPLHVIGGSVTFRFLKTPTIDNQAFVKYVSDFQPDVIHSHLYLSELLSRSKIFKGVKYISHGHDNMPQLKAFEFKTLFNKSLLVNYWERNWLLKQYKQCDNRFVAISEDVKKYFAHNLPAFANRIAYLPNAINIKRFETKRDYDRKTHPFHIVSIANLVPKKNHVFLIDIMKVLQDKGYDVTMEVLGSGPLMEMLVAKTETAGLQNRLFFRGSVGDVPQRLWNADLYVHPAWYEPFGLVILEAMASGLPVVALDGYGNRELMKEGQNGFMLPNRASAEDFANKIACFIDQPLERKRMGQFAFEFSKTYDMDHYTDKLIEIYQQ
jgi:glycosyltransferase involved in cell wall biosynthesis